MRQFILLLALVCLGFTVAKPPKGTGSGSGSRSGSRHHRGPERYACNVVNTDTNELLVDRVCGCGDVELADGVQCNLGPVDTVGKNDENLRVTFCNILPDVAVDGSVVWNGLLAHACSIEIVDGETVTPNPCKADKDDNVPACDADPITFTFGTTATSATATFCAKPAKPEDDGETEVEDPTEVDDEEERPDEDTCVGLSKDDDKSGPDHDHDDDASKKSGKKGKKGKKDKRENKGKKGKKDRKGRKGGKGKKEKKGKGGKKG